MRLADALQRWVTQLGPPLVVRPDRPAALREVLHALRSEGAVVGREVRIDRSAFTQLGAFDEVSLTVEAGAGLSLEVVESRAQAHGLSLGPLWPGATRCTLGAFLEGPWAGLRAGPGGRLEPLCSALRGVTPLGHLLTTAPGPRHATGPDLMALFLGGEGRGGLVVDAKVRLVPLSTTRVTHQAWVESPRVATNALRHLLREGLGIARAQIGRDDRRLRLSVECESHPSLTRRDQTLLAQALPHTTSTRSMPEPSGGMNVVEREWARVQLQLETEPSLHLFRLSLDTVLLGTVADSASPAWRLPDLVAQALDPNGTCAGASR